MDVLERVPEEVRGFALDRCTFTSVGQGIAGHFFPQPIRFVAIDEEVPEHTQWIVVIDGDLKEDDLRRCLPTRRPRVKPYCSKSSTVALKRKRPCASRPAVTSGMASTRPPPRLAIWSSDPSRPARAMPWPRCLLSTKMQVIRQSGRGGGSMSYSRLCLMPGSFSGLPYWHQP